MARFRARHVRVAVALIGFLLVGSIVAWAQSSARPPAHGELKKKKTAQPAARAKVKSHAASKQTAPTGKTPGKQTGPAQMSPTRAVQLPAPIAVPLPVAPPPERSQAPTTAPQGSTAQAPGERAQVLPASPGIRVSQTQLNMVRTAPEQIGQVPNHFFWIRQGLQAVQDPVDGYLVFLNDDGRVVGRARLPEGFEISDIFVEAEQIRLINAGRQITIQRSIDPASTTALQDGPVIGNGEVRALRLTRRGPQHLTLQDDRRAGARALDVRSVAGGHLAQAYEVSPGSGDNRYLVSEEIVGTKPTLLVRMFVQRFDRAGRFTGIAHVALDGMDAVPRNFVTVTEEGVVRVLVPMRDSIKIREVDFAAPPRGKRVSDDELKSLGRVLREIPVDANLTSGARAPFRSETAPPVELNIPTPPIKRDVVLQNARAYLAINWVLQRENFSKPGVENSCEPRNAKFWMRPRRFTEDKIGMTFGPMPYRWGGEDTPETYRLRTEWGALAGSICTCRDVTLNYCLFPDSAGVDCSGFVSRAWGIDKRGTSGLLDVADEVNSVDELKPGDAFNWAGRHVRLFVGTPPGAALAFTVLESSTRLECEGVCERTLRPSEVDGYRMIRYRGVSESGVAANGTAPAGTGQASTSQNDSSQSSPKKRAARKGATEARRR